MARKVLISVCRRFLTTVIDFLTNMAGFVAQGTYRQRAYHLSKVHRRVSLETGSSSIPCIRQKSSGQSRLALLELIVLSFFTQPLGNT